MSGQAALPREERLRRRADFVRLYRTGRRIEREGVLLFSQLGGAGRHVGISVSRRIGGSVERNQVRRRLREAYRLNKGLVPEGVDLLLVARPRVLKQSFEETCQDLARGLRKVGVGWRASEGTPVLPR